MAKTDYALGHSDPEIERLQIQAKCLEGVTRRLVFDSGIRRGMRGFGPRLWRWRCIDAHC